MFFLTRSSFTVLILPNLVEIVSSPTRLIVYFFILPLFAMEEAEAVMVAQYEVIGFLRCFID